MDNLGLDSKDREQINGVVATLREILSGHLVGVYLHGSAVLGGLRRHSDIDLLAVSARRMSGHEKDRLIGHLLAFSGRPEALGERHPIELTVVVASEIRPWRYPPTMDLQYGEWWREGFEGGELEPWPSRTNPDLALIVTMTLLGDAPLPDRRRPTSSIRFHART